MYRLIILFTAFVLIVPAQARTGSPWGTYYGSYYPYGKYKSPYSIRRASEPRGSNSNFSDISALEKYLFNKSYGRDNFLTRLQRLEAQTFGAIQHGDVNTRYERVKSAVLSRPKMNYKTSLLRGIKDYFSGQITGYTPSLDTMTADSYFDTDSYPYETSSVTELIGPFRRGYRVNNNGSASSFGVKILD